MKEIISRDLRHIWHPCSQMKDYERFHPQIIREAKGAYFHLENGGRLIDAISSWWCKSLGHGHPRLKSALLAQVDQFEHVMLCNATHETIVALSEQLAALTQSLSKVSYASDGSCAVEMAMKMSVHARQLLGQAKRTRFIALEKAHHGETLATLSVSDLGLYSKPYQPLLFDVDLIKQVPYVTGVDDPLWGDCSEVWPSIEAQLNPLAFKATALIVEPLVQGAGGMLIYSQDFLRRLRQWCNAHDVHLIADEIMTGIGRTGKMLACEHAGIEPDFLCLSKGLTSGWLPLSVMLTTQGIYDLFYDDYDKGKSFLHSHTQSGNALAASVALATLQVMREESICQRVEGQAPLLRSLMSQLAEETGELTRLRSLGAVVAADLQVSSPNRRRGYAVFQEAVKRGAFLRPLGNTIYWCPPLNTPESVLRDLQQITREAILATA